MSYNDVVKVQRSDALLSRVIACAAIERDDDPELFVRPKWWKFAAQPGWGDAWAYKEASLTAEEKAKNTDIGSLDSVITDGMILSAVQSIGASEEP